MCNYTYKHKKSSYSNNSSCPYSDYPIDSSGLCLFHSKDDIWKTENDFHNKFLELLIKYDTGNYSEFYFPPNINNTPILIKDLKYKTLDFSGSLFNVKIELFDSTISSLNINNCTINNSFKIKNTTSEDITAINSVLKDGIDIISSGITGLTNFENCEFLNTNNVPHNGINIIDSHINPVFIRTKINAFSFVIKKCTITSSAIFRDSIINGIFHFNENKIDGNVIFDNTEFIRDYDDNPHMPSIQFFNNTIHVRGILSFKGKRPYYDVFRYPISITFSNEPRSFPRDAVVFENINISNIENIRDFMSNCKGKDAFVKIKTGCLQYRCQLEPIELSGTDVFIQFCSDFYQAFSSYFNNIQSLFLGIEIIERSQTYISFFYYTDDDITEDELRERILKTQGKMSDTLLSIISKMDIYDKNHLSALSTFVVILNNISKNLEIAPELIESMKKILGPVITEVAEEIQTKLQTCIGNVQGNVINNEVQINYNIISTSNNNSHES